MRDCGGCTACCSALAVPELDKPTYQPCRHLCERGCGIYATRPRACRDYRCLWLLGHLGEADRPDQLGVIFTTTVDPEHREQGNLPMLIEVRDGALQQPAVQDAIQAFRRQKPTVLMTKDGREVLDVRDI